jgi:hypothetical protein
MVKILTEERDERKGEIGGKASPSRSVILSVVEGSVQPFGRLRAMIRRTSFKSASNSSYEIAFTLPDSASSTKGGISLARAELAGDDFALLVTGIGGNRNK